MKRISSRGQGTPQHRNATDISRWLVHLTRSEQDLISILKDGMIKARNAFGAGKYFPHQWARHRSVCLTEIPLHEISRMTEKRPWGIVFDKERLRKKFHAQPVWYVNDSSPQSMALSAAMEEAEEDEDWDSPLWALTPFIERVRGFDTGRPNDWRWEREWRVRGSLEFSLSDVAMIIIDEDGTPAFLEEVSMGLPLVSPDDVFVHWSGGFFDSWNDEVEGMLDRFQKNFVTPIEAGMPWVNEEKGFFSIVEILGTEDAMEEAFGHITSDLHEAIASGLDEVSPSWCRLYDLNYPLDFS